MIDSPPLSRRWEEPDIGERCIKQDIASLEHKMTGGRDALGQLSSSSCCNQSPVGLSGFSSDSLLRHPCKWEAVEIRYLEKDACKPFPQGQGKTPSPTATAGDRTESVDPEPQMKRQTVVVEKLHIRNLLNTIREQCGDLGTSRLSEYRPACPEETQLAREHFGDSNPTTCSEEARSLCGRLGENRVSPRSTEIRQKWKPKGSLDGDLNLYCCSFDERSPTQSRSELSGGISECISSRLGDVCVRHQATQLDSDSLVNNDDTSTSARDIRFICPTKHHTSTPPPATAPPLVRNRDQRSEKSRDRGFGFDSGGPILTEQEINAYKEMALRVLLDRKKVERQGTAQLLKKRSVHRAKRGGKAGSHSNAIPAGRPEGSILSGARVKEQIQKHKQRMPASPCTQTKQSNKAAAGAKSIAQSHSSVPSSTKQGWSISVTPSTKRASSWAETPPTSGNTSKSSKSNRVTPPNFVSVRKYNQRPTPIGNVVKKIPVLPQQKLARPMSPFSKTLFSALIRQEKENSGNQNFLANAKKTNFKGRLKLSDRKNDRMNNTVLSFDEYTSLMVQRVAVGKNSLSNVSKDEKSTKGDTQISGTPPRASSLSRLKCEPPISTDIGRKPLKSDMPSTMTRGNLTSMEGCAKTDSCPGRLVSQDMKNTEATDNQAQESNNQQLGNGDNHMVSTSQQGKQEMPQAEPDYEKYTQRVFEKCKTLGRLQALLKDRRTPEGTGVSLQPQNITTHSPQEIQNSSSLKSEQNNRQEFLKACVADQKFDNQDKIQSEANNLKESERIPSLQHNVSVEQVMRCYQELFTELNNHLLISDPNNRSNGDTHTCHKTNADPATTLDLTTAGSAAGRREPAVDIPAVAVSHTTTPSSQVPSLVSINTSHTLGPNAPKSTIYPTNSPDIAKTDIRPGSVQISSPVFKRATITVPHERPVSVPHNTTESSDPVTLSVAAKRRASATSVTPFYTLHAPFSISSPPMAGAPRLPVWSHSEQPVTSEVKKITPNHTPSSSEGEKKIPGFRRPTQSSLNKITAPRSRSASSSPSDRAGSRTASLEKIKSKGKFGDQPVVSKSALKERPDTPKPIENPLHTKICASTQPPILTAAPSSQPQKVQGNMSVAMSSMAAESYITTHKRSTDTPSVSKSEQAISKFDNILRTFRQRSASWTTVEGAALGASSNQEKSTKPRISKQIPTRYAQRKAPTWHPKQQSNLDKSATLSYSDQFKLTTPEHLHGMSESALHLTSIGKPPVPLTRKPLRKDPIWSVFKDNDTVNSSLVDIRCTPRSAGGRAHDQPVNVIPVEHKSASKEKPDTPKPIDNPLHTPPVICASNQPPTKNLKPEENQRLKELNPNNMPFNTEISGDTNALSEVSSSLSWPSSKQQTKVTFGSNSDSRLLVKRSALSMQGTGLNASVKKAQVLPDRTEDATCQQTTSFSIQTNREKVSLTEQRDTLAERSQSCADGIRNIYLRVEDPGQEPVSSITSCGAETRHAVPADSSVDYVLIADAMLSVPTRTLPVDYLPTRVYNKTACQQVELTPSLPRPTKRQARRHDSPDITESSEDKAHKSLKCEADKSLQTQAVAKTCELVLNKTSHDERSAKSRSPSSRSSWILSFSWPDRTTTTNFQTSVSSAVNPGVTRRGKLGSAVVEENDVTPAKVALSNTEPPNHEIGPSSGSWTAQQENRRSKRKSFTSSLVRCPSLDSSSTDQTTLRAERKEEPRFERPGYPRPAFLQKTLLTNQTRTQSDTANQGSPISSEETLLPTENNSSNLIDSVTKARRTRLVCKAATVGDSRCRARMSRPTPGPRTKDPTSSSSVITSVSQSTIFGSKPNAKTGLQECMISDSNNLSTGLHESSNTASSTLLSSLKTTAQHVKFSGSLKVSNELTTESTRPTPLQGTRSSYTGTVTLHSSTTNSVSEINNGVSEAHRACPSSNFTKLEDCQDSLIQTDSSEMDKMRLYLRKTNRCEYPSDWDTTEPTFSHGSAACDQASYTLNDSIDKLCAMQSARPNVRKSQVSLAHTLVCLNEAQLKDGNIDSETGVPQKIPGKDKSTQQGAPSAFSSKIVPIRDGENTMVFSNIQLTCECHSRTSYSDQDNNLIRQFHDKKTSTSLAQCNLPSKNTSIPYQTLEEHLAVETKETNTSLKSFKLATRDASEQTSDSKIVFCATESNSTKDHIKSNIGQDTNVEDDAIRPTLSLQCSDKATGVDSMPASLALAEGNVKMSQGYVRDEDESGHFNNVADNTGDADKTTCVAKQEKLQTGEVRETEANGSPKKKLSRSKRAVFSHLERKVLENLELFVASVKRRPDSVKNFQSPLSPTRQIHALHLGLGSQSAPPPSNCCIAEATEVSRDSFGWSFDTLSRDQDLNSIHRNSDTDRWSSAGSTATKLALQKPQSAHVCNPCREQRSLTWKDELPSYSRAWRISTATSFSQSSPRKSAMHAPPTCSVGPDFAKLGEAADNLKSSERANSGILQPVISNTPIDNHLFNSEETNPFIPDIFQLFTDKHSFVEPASQNKNFVLSEADIDFLLEQNAEKDSENQKENLYTLHKGNLSKNRSLTEGKNSLNFNEDVSAATFDLCKNIFFKDGPKADSPRFRENDSDQDDNRSSVESLMLLISPTVECHPKDPLHGSFEFERKTCTATDHRQENSSPQSVTEKKSTPSYDFSPSYTRWINSEECIVCNAYCSDHNTNDTCQRDEKLSSISLQSPQSVAELTTTIKMPSALDKLFCANRLKCRSHRKKNHFVHTFLNVLVEHAIQLQKAEDKNSRRKARERTVRDTIRNLAGEMVKAVESLKEGGSCNSSLCSKTKRCQKIVANDYRPLATKKQRKLKQRRPSTRSSSTTTTTTTSTSTKTAATSTTLEMQNVFRDGTRASCSFICDPQQRPEGDCARAPANKTRKEKSSPKTKTASGANVESCHENTSVDKQLSDIKTCPLESETFYSIPHIGMSFGDSFLEHFVTRENATPRATTNDHILLKEHKLKNVRSCETLRNVAGHDLGTLGTDINAATVSSKSSEVKISLSEHHQQIEVMVPQNKEDLSTKEGTTSCALSQDSKEEDFSREKLDRNLSAESNTCCGVKKNASPEKNKIVKSALQPTDKEPTYVETGVPLVTIETPLTGDRVGEGCNDRSCETQVVDTGCMTQKKGGKEFPQEGQRFITILGRQETRDHCEPATSNSYREDYTENRQNLLKLNLVRNLTCQDIFASLHPWPMIPVTLTPLPGEESACCESLSTQKRETSLAENERICCSDRDAKIKPGEEVELQTEEIQCLETRGFKALKAGRTLEEIYLSEEGGVDVMFLTGAGKDTFIIEDIPLMGEVGETSQTDTLPPQLAALPVDLEDTALDQAMFLAFGNGEFQNTTNGTTLHHNVVYFDENYDDEDGHFVHPEEHFLTGIDSTKAHPAGFLMGQSIERPFSFGKACKTKTQNSEHENTNKGNVRQEDRRGKSISANKGNYDSTLLMSHIPQTNSTLPGKTKPFTGSRARNQKHKSLSPLCRCRLGNRSTRWASCEALSSPTSRPKLTRRLLEDDPDLDTYDELGSFFTEIRDRSSSSRNSISSTSTFSTITSFCFGSCSSLNVIKSDHDKHLRYIKKVNSTPVVTSISEPSLPCRSVVSSSSLVAERSLQVVHAHAYIDNHTRKTGTKYLSNQKKFQKKSPPASVLYTDKRIQVGATEKTCSPQVVPASDSMACSILKDLVRFSLTNYVEQVVDKKLKTRLKHPGPEAAGDNRDGKVEETVRETRRGRQTKEAKSPNRQTYQDNMTQTVSPSHLNPKMLKSAEVQVNPSTFNAVKTNSEGCQTGVPISVSVQVLGGTSDGKLVPKESKPIKSHLHYESDKTCTKKSHCQWEQNQRNSSQARHPLVVTKLDKPRGVKSTNRRTLQIPPSLPVKQFATSPSPIVKSPKFHILTGLKNDTCHENLAPVEQRCRYHNEERQPFLVDPHTDVGSGQLASAAPSTANTKSQHHAGSSQKGDMKVEKVQSSTIPPQDRECSTLENDYAPLVTNKSPELCNTVRPLNICTLCEYENGMTGRQQTQSNRRTCRKDMSECVAKARKSLSQINSPERHTVTNYSVSTESLSHKDTHSSSESSHIDYGDLKHILSRESKELWKQLTALERSCECCNQRKRKYKRATTKSLSPKIVKQFTKGSGTVKCASGKDDGCSLHKRAMSLRQNASPAKVQRDVTSYMLPRPKDFIDKRVNFSETDSSKTRGILKGNGQEVGGIPGFRKSSQFPCNNSDNQTSSSSTHQSEVEHNQAKSSSYVAKNVPSDKYDRMSIELGPSRTSTNSFLGKSKTEYTEQKIGVAPSQASGFTTRSVQPIPISTDAWSESGHESRRSTFDRTPRPNSTSPIKRKSQPSSEEMPPHKKMSHWSSCGTDVWRTPRESLHTSSSMQTGERVVGGAYRRAGSAMGNNTARIIRLFEAASLSSTYNQMNISEAGSSNNAASSCNSIDIPASETESNNISYTLGPSLKHNVQNIRPTTLRRYLSNPRCLSDTSICGTVMKVNRGSEACRRVRSAEDLLSLTAKGGFGGTLRPIAELPLEFFPKPDGSNDLTPSATTSVKSVSCEDQAICYWLNKVEPSPLSELTCALKRTSSQKVTIDESVRARSNSTDVDICIKTLGNILCEMRNAFPATATPKIQYQSHRPHAEDQRQISKNRNASHKSDHSSVPRSNSSDSCNVEQTKRFRSIKKRQLETSQSEGNQVLFNRDRKALDCDQETKPKVVYTLTSTCNRGKQTDSYQANACRNEKHDLVEKSFNKLKRKSRLSASPGVPRKIRPDYVYKGLDLNDSPFGALLGDKFSTRHETQRWMSSRACSETCSTCGPGVFSYHWLHEALGPTDWTHQEHLRPESCPRKLLSDKQVRGISNNWDKPYKTEMGQRLSHVELGDDVSEQQQVVPVKAMTTLIDRDNEGTPPCNSPKAHHCPIPKLQDTSLQKDKSRSGTPYDPHCQKVCVSTSAIELRGLVATESRYEGLRSGSKQHFECTVLEQMRPTCNENGCTHRDYTEDEENSSHASGQPFCFDYTGEKSNILEDRVLPKDINVGSTVTPTNDKETETCLNVGGHISLNSDYLLLNPQNKLTAHFRPIITSKRDVVCSSLNMQSSALNVKENDKSSKDVIRLNNNYETDFYQGRTQLSQGGNADLSVLSRREAHRPDEHGGNARAFSQVGSLSEQQLQPMPTSTNKRNDYHHSTGTLPQENERNRQVSEHICKQNSKHEGEESHQSDAIISGKSSRVLRPHRSEASRHLLARDLSHARRCLALHQHPGDASLGKTNSKGRSSSYSKQSPTIDLKGLVDTDNYPNVSGLETNSPNLIETNFCKDACLDKICDWSAGIDQTLSMKLQVKDIPNDATLHPYPQRASKDKARKKFHLKNLLPFKIRNNLFRKKK